MTKGKKSVARTAGELVAIIAVAIVLALGIQAFLVKPYQIPTGSMIPTLTIGQRVLVDRIGQHFSTPHVGDIYVFHPPVNDTGCANPNQGETASGEVKGIEKK